ncbi:TetR/AcrR family transcriptional regulator [Nocardioides sp. TF02-7]|uniref:TetR/AcrR family transcriptional regulator n=1 Tax=Nocardioides sp. TF02-7 TaxID=2917724 RepID=UPI001F05728C|nr:TetR/AcrR family transcriptional regulator [Nocardioides sp. TF02-7]UMG91732.1 TetR/AcrR family transcriptional regulator [Nocardioides sp. TF02-7]
MTSTAARLTGTKGVARADREQQIVAVAGEVFAERGFALASVDEIARRAGISKPLIYNYFGSKEGLLAACLAYAGTLVADEIERTARLGEVGLARALVSLDGLFRALEPAPWTWRLLNDPTVPGGPELDPVLATYRSRMAALSADGVGELMRLAGDDDPADTDAMTAVWTSVLDALVTWWLDHPAETPEQMSRRCVRLFAAVLGPVDVDLPGRSG